MSAVRRLAGGLLLVLATLVGVATSASAYWTANGTGTGSATTATLNPPTSVTASSTAGVASVSVTWSASMGGVAPQGYTVIRTIQPGNVVTAPACGGVTISGLSCTDSPVAAGTYTYTVTAVYASWSTPSAPSSPVSVVVDNTAPSVSVTRVNGLTPLFPYRTTGPISTIGGTCGTAAGDLPTVSAFIGGDPTTPATAPCTGGTWTLTLSPSVAADGTYAVTARQSDVAGNTGAAPLRTVTIDTTAPVLVAITRAGPSPTNVNPLVWTLSFSEPVSGLTGSNLALARANTGGSPPSISQVVAAGPVPSATWTVTVTTAGTTGQNNGSIRLDLQNRTGITDQSGFLLATMTFTGEAYEYDTTRPTLNSLNRAGATQLANGGPLLWTVGFSEPTVGVAANHFQLTTSGLIGTPVIGAPVPTSGSSPASTWTVPVSVVGVTATSGSIRLDRVNVGGITDAAGNALNTPSRNGQPYTLDNTAPTVTNVTSSATGTTPRGAGATIPITVAFTEAVTVTGTPTLTLATGTPGATVPYTSGSGTNTLTFIYIVAAGQNSPDLDYATPSSLTLNGGTILDAAGNTAALTLPAPGSAGSLGANKALVIDTTAPAVALTSVNGTPRAFPYVTNQTVTSVGGPCTIGDGAVTVLANGTSLGTTTCSATTGTWLLATNWTTTSTRSVSATQADAAGNVGAAAAVTVTVDKTPSVVTGVSSTQPDGAYRAGTIIPVTVTFDEPVTVTGTPQLTLATGTPATTAVDYTSGSGTATLTFAYTVGATNTSADLNYEAIGSLALNGGTIRDVAGNNAALTLPAIGAATSLAGSRDLVIDTTSPWVTAVSSTQADGAYRAGTTIPITVTFSEPVTVGVPGGTPMLALATGSPNTTAIAYGGGSGTSTLNFTYTVADGNTSADLDYSTSASLTLNGATIGDVAGNDANLTLPVPGGAGSLRASKALVIDTTSPAVTVTSVTGWLLFTVTGTAEPGAGPVTAHLCLNSPATCDAGNATRTLTGIAVQGDGSWTSTFLYWGSGPWSASARQTDAAGNAGVSPTYPAN